MLELKLFVESMAEKGYIFKATKSIDKKELNTRKKLDIFSCTDIDGNYHIAFATDQKSRFVRAHASDIFILEQKVQEIQKHNNKYKHIFISAPLCSKAKNEFLERGWRVYNDFM